ncbi:MAG: cobalamin-dependent protein [Desulfobacteraceae bacterium]|jgi:5-methyltetrahydrofolate--homocysteine methyltransferase
MSNLDPLKEAVVEMQEDKALLLTQHYLDEGLEPASLFGAFQEALIEIGNRFEKEVYFIPELIMSGEMMKKASELIKPHLTESADGEKKLGKVLIATVQGDIHDIGKNIVTMLLEINGFDVKDIGVDVAGDTILDEAEAFGADIIGLSGLLTLAFDPMKEVLELLNERGLRNKYKVLIGGGQMDEQVCTYTGADAFVTDAVAGVKLCKRWVGFNE